MNNIPLILEGLVVLLLAITIGYCLVLERRMRAFRDGQERLRALVDELSTATIRAEQAIGGLGNTTREAEAALEHRIAEARKLVTTLALASSNGGVAAVPRAAVAKSPASPRKSPMRRRPPTPPRPEAGR